VTLGRGVWLRALAFAAAVGLAWIGVAFLAYGLYLALIPALHIAGAALVTALVCLAIGALLIVALVTKTPAAPLPTAPTAVETEVVETNAMIKALSDLAQDHPIMAVCAAAILGATNGATPVRRR
jgi:hypothetical protein